MASPISSCPQNPSKTEIGIEIESSPPRSHNLRPAVSAIDASSSAAATTTSTSCNFHSNHNFYCEALLNRLEQILPSEIRMKLKISFDALNQDEQQIFLGIACFFVGEERDMAIRIWDRSGWKGSLGFEHLHKRCLVEVIENQIKMHEQLRDMGRKIAEASGLARRIWRWTESINDLLENFSYATTEVRGIRAAGVDNPESDDKSSQISCYKRWSHQLLQHCVKKLCHNTAMKKLQLLDNKGDLVERFLRRVRLPNFIWLRWNKCPWFSLPSWIPMKNLRVLDVRGRN